MFYGIAPDDKSDDTLAPKFVVSDEFNGGNRNNEDTVRPRWARAFPGGLWEMIIENGTSRVLLGVHWIFDAFDFKEDKETGELIPDLSNENIGGVPLGLRIARDIFAFGSGLAPLMTPNGTANPPITTPPPNSPMPALPKQPASVHNCADASSRTEEEEAGSDDNEPIQKAFPTGSSEKGQSTPEGDDVYPSGLSEK